ncbi:sensor histidine kinase [Myxococcus stipitatus DSM 14675]|uniref:histidine kinase n=2 Tax=Myxococcus stipitatus TaxID=83455 RepID=L7UAA8_MYXSD|nr:sensor histidine kinase [Myxococcus stipitatus DSM 14675]
MAGVSLRMSNQYEADAPAEQSRAGQTGPLDVMRAAMPVAESGLPEAKSLDAAVEARACALLWEYLAAVRRRVDRLGVGLMVGQWLFALALAVAMSAHPWDWRVRPGLEPLWVALLWGGPLCLIPSTLALLRPGAGVTRHVMAAAQVLWSVLLVHLSGARLETYFHVFGSLALVTFYRDARVLLTAGVAAVVAHLLRGIGWPQAGVTVAGTPGGSVLELVFWVGLVDGVLVLACRGATREMKRVAERQALLARAKELELLERERMLERSGRELKDSREQVARMEKLAAVGKLTATVSHELRNPLAAARTANAAVVRRLRQVEGAREDARLQRFLDIVERELAVCASLTSEMLEFVRERPLVLRACPLHGLVEEAVDVVPRREGVRVENRVPAGLEPPWVDRELLRQVLINLVQNAAESMPPGREGVVAVSAELSGGRAFHIRVTDNGGGIPAQVLDHIFEPLFTTKEHGTGLGLTVVASTVRQHGGTLRVESREGEGSVFTICLPHARATAEVACPS